MSRSHLAFSFLRVWLQTAVWAETRLSKHKQLFVVLIRYKSEPRGPLDIWESWGWSCKMFFFFNLPVGEGKRLTFTEHLLWTKLNADAFPWVYYLSPINLSLRFAANIHSVKWMTAFPQSHFIGWETETHKDEVTCPRSLCSHVVGLEFHLLLLIPHQRSHSVLWGPSYPPHLQNRRP